MLRILKISKLDLFFLLYLGWIYLILSIQTESVQLVNLILNLCLVKNRN